MLKVDVEIEGVGSGDDSGFAEEVSLSEIGEFRF